MSDSTRFDRRAATWLLVMTAPVSLFATESDLHTTVTGPPSGSANQTLTITVEYGNDGPEPAETAYLNLAIPSGVPASIDELTDDQLDALVGSATGTDTLGNTPLLYIDDSSCEGLVFQLQGPVPPGALGGMAPGGEGSFSFELPIPMEPPKLGSIAIVEPNHLAREYLPALTRHQMILPGDMPRYTPGLNCDSTVGGCAELEDCFGPRLSLMEPITSQLEIVDDGGASGDPALGCDPLVNFTAGHIALIRRGECPYADKASNAQDAGASGIIVVNNGQCSGLGADNPNCVVPMPGGDGAGAIDIPVAMVSLFEGEGLISEITAGETITVIMGARAGGLFELSSYMFTTDPTEIDPEPSNNGHSLAIQLGIFVDGFEAGDAASWSAVTTRPRLPTPLQARGVP